MKAKRLIALALLAVCAIAVMVTVFLITSAPKDGEPIITNELVIAKLESIRELATAHLTYNGLLHYEDGKIPLLTKKAFFMMYHAEVKAGIDLSDVDVNISAKKLTLTIPQAEIFDIYVVPESIQFYDEKNALFNASDKTDALEAITAAEADVRAKADLAQLRDTANTQTVALLEGLFDGFINGLTLVIKFK